MEWYEMIDWNAIGEKIWNNLSLPVKNEVRRLGLAPKFDKMEYRLLVKKYKNGNYTIWKVNEQGIYYSILKADKELLKKMAETLKEAGF